MVRFINDILLSAPSIVVGLFVYDLMVLPHLPGFSGIAGAIALAVLVIPVVVRTTEDMLALVPKELREAASALGMPLAYVIAKVSYRAALAGIVHRRPARHSAHQRRDRAAPVHRLQQSSFQRQLQPVEAYGEYLPAAIFFFALSPYEEWQKLSPGRAP